MNEHDQEDPTVHHQAMVLTRNIAETNQYTNQMNTTARRDTAASYTGGTKNFDRVLRQFENGKYTSASNMYYSNFLKEKLAFWLYVENCSKDTTERRSASVL